MDLGKYFIPYEDARRLVRLCAYEEMLTSDMDIADDLRDLILTPKEAGYRQYLIDNYFYGDEEKFKYLEFSMDVPMKIVEKFGIAMGEPFSFLHELDKEFTFEDWFSSYVWGGYSVFLFSIESDGSIYGKPKMQYVNPQNYLKENGNHVILYHLEDDQEQYQNKQFSLKPQYTMKVTYNDNDRTITRQLFKKQFGADGTTKIESSYCGQEVPLNSTPYLSQFQPSESYPNGIDRCVFVVKNSYSVSQIGRVASQIRAIRTEWASIDNILRDHTRGILTIPASALRNIKVGADNRIKRTDLEVITSAPGDKDPTYTVKPTGTLQESFKKIENLLRSIAASLSMPVEHFGLEGPSGNESFQKSTLRLGEFIRKIETARSRFENVLSNIKDSYVAIGALENSEDESDFTMEWPEIIPTTKSEKTEYYNWLIGNGLMSKRKYLIDVLGYDEEEADFEIETIAKENGGLNLNELPR